VLLVDSACRVLMLRCVDADEPGGRCWITVGGGLEPGESAADAAARELYEETGLRVAPADLGPPVWRDVVEFGFDGERYRQRQEFFLCQVPTWDVACVTGAGAEHAVIDGHRWWTPAELVVTAETYYPEVLPELLRRLLEE